MCNRSQGGRHPEGTRVHFSANRRFLADNAGPENMDLTPFFPPCERLRNGQPDLAVTLAMLYNTGSPPDAPGNGPCDYAQSEDLIGASGRATGLNPNQEPRRHAMANKDQKNRTTNNKPKLSAKGKKERKERNAAAKQRDR
jgi:hypothetical protein